MVHVLKGSTLYPRPDLGSFQNAAPPPFFTSAQMPSVSSPCPCSVQAQPAYLSATTRSQSPALFHARGRVPHTQHPTPALSAHLHCSQSDYNRAVTWTQQASTTWIIKSPILVWPHKGLLVYPLLPFPAWDHHPPALPTCHPGSLSIPSGHQVLSAPGSCLCSEHFFLPL